MNKADLITEIATAADISKATAAKALDAVTKAVSAALKAGDKVTLVGFGTFSVATRGPRTGRNPRTGANIKIVAKKVAKFKPGKKLADDVNGKGAKKKK